MRNKHVTLGNKLVDARYSANQLQNSDWSETVANIACQTWMDFPVELFLVYIVLYL